ncbi:MAG: CBS domain-containing protein [Oleiphilaceae bacterium]|nr:CBS domain-containing protein [Oleiphilaceae bacterium]
MSIFVSEPGRPVATRLPESITGRRVDALDGLKEIKKQDPNYNQANDPAFVHAKQAQARRALTEYGEASDDEPEANRHYLPIAKICSARLFTLPASARLDEALTKMDEQGIQHLVILAEQSVAGLVDLRWLLAWLHEHRANAQGQSFTQVELPAFLTATPETDAHHVARLMLAHQLSAALVMDPKGTAVGIVTSTDYLRLYADISSKAGVV